MLSQQVRQKKKSMTWLDLKIWLEEQKEVLKHSYIDDVYYLKSGPLLLLKLYNTVKNLYYWLIVEPAKRVSITLADLRLEEADEKARKVWRGLLRNCMIVDIYQIPCERILHLKLNCRPRTRVLAIELLPRGVSCVLDEQGKILLCNEYRTMRDRTIRPGLQYQLPPASNICNRTLSQIKQIAIDKSANVNAVLVKEYGLPPEVAETLAIQCGLDKKSVAELGDDDVMCISTSYEHLIADVLGNYKPCIVFDLHGVPIGFYPHVPPLFQGFKAECLQTFNDVVNKYFEDELKSILISSMSSDVIEAVNSTKDSIDRIDHLLEKMKKELNELVLKIETIESKYIELEQIHQCVVERVKTSGWSSVKVCGPISSISPEKGMYQVLLNNITLELDVRKSFIDNYNDLRKTLAGIERSIAKAEEEKKMLLNKLEMLTKEVELRKAKTQYKLQRVKEWYEAFIWYITSSGFLVIGGKDASQNIKIIRKLLEPSDIVLHADIPGASTVVIKTGGKTVDNKDVEEAATIAASYSKAWKLKLMSVDVFWVYGSQVSLSPPSGQYLPKGSYMVYGTKNYIKNVELRLAIGIEITNNQPRVIVGPEEVVDRRAIMYFVVVPGDLEPKDIGIEFVELLKSRCHMDVATAIDANDIARRLPGKSNIIKKVVKLV